MVGGHHQSPGGVDTAAEPPEVVVSEESQVQLAGFLAGSRLAGYRLEAQAGAGGMAVVWRARDERLNRLVALKILAPGMAADSAFRRRFIGESRAAAAVDDPHIIPVYEAGEADGVLFIAMRFVQGGDLRQVLRREGALPPDRAAEFVSPVASALDAAHRAGLVHRDVKPANVLVDAQEGRPDHVYLSDFGVSKGAMSAAGLTGTGMFIGTPDYSAPEQIQGRPVDGRTDQYALACVTYQLLTGTVPFERDQPMAVLYAQLSAPPPSVVSQRPGLPAAVDQVVAKGMAKVPEKRYESCGDFADALRDAIGLAPYHRPRPATAPPLPPPPSAPGGGSAGIAGVPVSAGIDVTGPDVPLREADGDSGTAGPRWRRRRRFAVRKRHGPSPADPAAPGPSTPAAAAAAPAESQPAGDLGTAASSGHLASPPPPAISSADIPSLVAVAPVTPVDLGAAVEPDPGVAVEPDPGVAVGADLAAAVDADLSAAAEGDPETVTFQAVSGAVMAGTAEAAAVAPVTGPGLPGGEADDAVGTAPPTGTMTAAPGDMPAAAIALTERQPTGDLGTAAMRSEPASPSASVASPSELMSPAVSDTPALPADPTAVSSGPALASTVDAAPAGAGGLPASALVTGPATGPGGVVRETDDGGTTEPPAPGPDALTNPGTGMAVPAQHPQFIDADRPGTISAWIPRRRLAAVAVACAILAAAATLPFVTTSAAHSPSPRSSPSPGNSAPRGQSPGPASPPVYSRVAIDLPAAYESIVPSVAFSPSGTTLAIAALSVCLWDIASQDCVPGPRLTTALSVAFSPDGNLLAAGDGTNGFTYLWSVAAKTMLVARLPDPAGEGVNSVAFSPDGKTLAAGDTNSRTFLWDVATQKLIATLTDYPSNGVYSVAFSPDGKILAAGDGNGRTFLWNATTDKPIGSVADLGGKGVESVAFSPDGEILAAGDANGSTFLWNIAAQKLITTLTDPGSGGISSVAFSPNGKTLATADENNNGHVYLWRIS
jgi:serine/threonine protein kinase/WD40 repeat protein